MKNGQFANAMRNSTKIHSERRQPTEIPKPDREPLPSPGLHGRKPITGLNGQRQKPAWESNIEKILQKYQHTVPEARLEIPKTQPEVVKSKWSELEVSYPGRNLVQNAPSELYNDHIRINEKTLKETKPLPPQTPDSKLIAKDENKSKSGITTGFMLHFDKKTGFSNQFLRLVSQTESYEITSLSIFMVV